MVEHLSPTQASHQCGLGSIPGLGVKCGLSLLLVLVLAPRGFSPGSPVFPSPQKPTFPNSNSIWNPRATGLSVISLLSVKEIPSSPNRSRTYDLPITSSDVLPLSYRRLVGAKAIKLGSITFPLIAHMPLIDILILAVCRMFNGLSSHESPVAQW